MELCNGVGVQQISVKKCADMSIRLDHGMEMTMEWFNSSVVHHLKSER